MRRFNSSIIENRDSNKLNSNKVKNTIDEISSNKTNTKNSLNMKSNCTNSGFFNHEFDFNKVRKLYKFKIVPDFGVYTFL